MEQYFHRVENPKKKRAGWRFCSNLLHNRRKRATRVDMIWSSYLSGLVLGVGVCSLHCSLLLLPMAARLNATWQGGVRTAVMFGTGKSLVLCLYGGLAAVLGFLVHDFIGHAWISFAAGLMAAAMGIWFLLQGGSCGCLARRGSPFLFGVVDGAVPCAATSGFLLFLATQGGGMAHGMLNGLVFGLGTVSGPLIPLCGLVPGLWRRLSQNRAAHLALRAVGAAVFFFWAWRILTGGWA